MAKNEPIKVIYNDRPILDKEHPYVMFSVELSNKALAELSSNAFKLWFYLSRNRTDEWVLVRNAFAKAANVSPNTFDKAKKELIDFGYLIVEDDNEKILRFVDEPQDMVNDSGEEIDMIAQYGF